MRYRLNLIRERQQEQRASAVRRKRAAGLVALCFGVLALSVFYGLVQIVTMRSAVNEERARLARIKEEYQHYKASTMIVSKADVELLDRLQKSRIFWTKKLAVMARHLPEDFWITRFDYDRQTLTVDGYGYITYEQRQLITLHDYLDDLRKDKSFNDVFSPVYLNSTIRNDDESRRARVSFNYAGVGGPKP